MRMLCANVESMFNDRVVNCDVVRQQRPWLSLHERPPMSVAYRNANRNGPRERGKLLSAVRRSIPQSTSPGSWAFSNS